MLSETPGTTNVTIPLEPPAPPAHHSRWRLAVATGLFRSGLTSLLGQASESWYLDPEKRFSFRRAPRPKFGILCYHRIGTRGLPLYSALPPAVFEKQMRYIRKRYRVLSISELCEEIANPRSLEPAIAITFDDGYGDLARYAFPILRKYEIPATIFLAVGAIESGEVAWYDRIFAILQALPERTLELDLHGAHKFSLGSSSERLEAAQAIMRFLRAVPDAQRLQYCANLESRVVLPASALQGQMLTWEQVRAMHRAGISFGSHTISHRVMGRLDPHEVRNELCESKSIIEQRLGHPIDSFAFPFGKPADIGAVSPEMLAKCGYRCAMTTIEAVNDLTTNPYALCRTQLGEEQSLPVFAWKLNALFLSGAPRPGRSNASRNATNSEQATDIEVEHA